MSAKDVVSSWPEWKQKIRLTKYSPERSQTMKIKKGQTVWLVSSDGSWRLAIVQPDIVKGRHGCLRLKVFTDAGAIEVVERVGSSRLSFTDPALANHDALHEGLDNEG